MNQPTVHGPAPEVLAQLRSWGTRANMPEVKAFFSQRTSDLDRSGLSVVADQAYGPHARQRMDIYFPQNHEPARPVLLYLHGGGFIRGDKSDRANVGWWGARQGFVTVLANYRLAPEAQWPSGAHDVRAACDHLRDLCGAFGGNPNAIVVAGESAGAAHAAAGVLMTEFQSPKGPCAGVFLLSGPYDAQLEYMARGALGIPTPDPRNDAYFGVTHPDWAAVSIVECVDAAPLPVAVAMTERDLPQMQVQAGALFSRLVTRHGFQPDFLVIPEHNHFSAAAALGTEDQSLADPLARFVQACADRSHLQA